MGRVVEVTFLLILVFLLVSNGEGAAQVIQAIAGGYTASIQVLQGRKQAGYS